MPREELWGSQQLDVLMVVHLPKHMFVALMVVALINVGMTIADG
jgi:hypothetical protein